MAMAVGRRRRTGSGLVDQSTDCWNVACFGLGLPSLSAQSFVHLAIAARDRWVLLGECPLLVVEHS